MKNTKSVEIRAAKAADIAALTELSHRTVLTKYPSVIGLEMVQGYVESGAVPAYYNERLEHVLVAVLEGRIVGCYGLKEDAIDLMMVDVDFHRKGIGQVSRFSRMPRPGSLRASKPSFLIVSPRMSRPSVSTRNAVGSRSLTSTIPTTESRW